MLYIDSMEGIYCTDLFVWSYDFKKDKGVALLPSYNYTQLDKKMW